MYKSSTKTVLLSSYLFILEYVSLWEIMMIVDLNDHVLLTAYVSGSFGFVLQFCCILFWCYV